MVVNIVPDAVGGVVKSVGVKSLVGLTTDY